MTKNFLTTVFTLSLLATAAWADDTQKTGDLIIGPGIEEGQSFYNDGVFKLGDKTVRIERGTLPGGKKVQYNAEFNLVIVNEDPSISEDEKDVALIGLLDALTLQETILPAAGEETDDNGISVTTE